jgi:hypothetical protein
MTTGSDLLDGPVLATADQREAERLVLALIADPDFQAMQGDLRAELAATATGQTHDGSRQLDQALAQWTNSLIFAEVTAYQPVPAFIWATDNTPRSWFGHDLPGNGIAGDNPDFIYRRLTVDGDGQFEIAGRINLAHRPAEMTMEVMRGNVGPMQLKNQTKTHADMGNQVGVIDDRSLAIETDGSFRIQMGGVANGPNHIPLEPGEMTVLVRDVLADWSQQPAALAIRRTGGADAPARDLAALKQGVIAKLPDYVRFWGNYHTTWLGGLEPNGYAGPVMRDGGWGFIAGLRFQLAPDEALLVTTSSGGAGYAGFQLCDNWMISPNARRHQASLNLTQAVPNPDGTRSYAITPVDPGLHNWVDSAGLHNGLALMRWHAVPPGVAKEDLIREVRVVTLSALDDMPLPRVSPDQRKAQMAMRQELHAARASE